MKGNSANNFQFSLYIVGYLSCSYKGWTAAGFEYKAGFGYKDLGGQLLDLGRMREGLKFRTQDLMISQILLLNEAVFAKGNYFFHQKYLL